MSGWVSGWEVPASPVLGIASPAAKRKAKQAAHAAARCSSQMRQSDAAARCSAPRMAQRQQRWPTLKHAGLGLALKHHLRVLLLVDLAAVHHLLHCACSTTAVHKSVQSKQCMWLDGTVHQLFHWVEKHPATP